MTREMTTLDLIQLLRSSRLTRSSYLPMYEDLAQQHYLQLRDHWIKSQGKDLSEWSALEEKVKLVMWQGGNHPEEWLKFAYRHVSMD